MMEHKAGLTISRPTCGNGDEYISIQIKDVDAKLKFVELHISYAKFTEALTGRSEVDCEIKVTDLHNVGRIKESKEFIFEMPKGSGMFYDNKDAAKDEALRLADKGWTPSLYFGSQNSFYQKFDKYYAKTTQSRWVDKFMGAE
jgi:hypothetical protein